MANISTHVLDLATGRPAAGVAVRLERAPASAAEPDAGWEIVGRGLTDADGRVRALLPDEAALAAAVYRVVFATGDWVAAQGGETFYPEVVITFRIGDAAQHHHVPLLLGPFGYTTYRGS